MKRNKIRIFLGTVLTIVTLTIGALLGGCTCRASVKPMASAAPTRNVTMAPAATAAVTIVPAASQTPMASDGISPSTSPMTSEGTGGGTP